MAQPDPFRLESYDYELPESLIAQKPAIPRDSSRLLVVRRSQGTWEHHVFRDLPDLLDSKDVCVANNSRVMRARLLGHRLRFEPGQGPGGGDWVPGGGVELVLLEQRGPTTWEGLFKASAKYVPGFRFEVPTPDQHGLKGTLVRGSASSTHGTVVVEFDRDPLGCGVGEIPLPHYIRREPDADDAAAYQTLYAKQPGSAAAPTAGLHFTEDVLARLGAKGVGWEELALNVGVGTFRPVKAEDIREHRIHEERYEIGPETASRLNDAKAEGRRIVAVGTTSVRALESAWREGGGEIKPGLSRTSLFIRPGDFEFRVVDRLLTNFHLPRSTLLIMVCTFGGMELILEAYREAVRQKYRFFSYGDAMLVL